jgi:hypothetical protein
MMMMRKEKKKKMKTKQDPGQKRQTGKVKASIESEKRRKKFIFNIKHFQYEFGV